MLLRVFIGFFFFLVILVILNFSLKEDIHSYHIVRTEAFIMNNSEGASSSDMEPFF